SSRCGCGLRWLRQEAPLRSNATRCAATRNITHALGGINAARACAAPPRARHRVVQGPPMQPIRFGTDGWRGVIADAFTFEGVRPGTQAVADLIHEEGGTAAPVPVGHDVRFLSRQFAECAAAVLEGNGLTALLPESATTTPMVSCQVV